MKKFLIPIFLILLCGTAHADSWYDTVNASTDDVDWSIDATPDTTMYLTGAAIYLSPANVSAGSGAAFRFLTCPIPAGATILACSCGYQSNAASTHEGVTSIFSFEDTADAATFSDKADLGARHWTTAVDTAALPTFAANTRYWVIVDNAVFQEVIDRADWEEGNDIAYRTVRGVEVAGQAKTLAWDYTQDYCAELRVYFTTGGAPAATRRRVMLLK